MKIKYRIQLLRKEFNSIRLIRTITKKRIESVIKLDNKTVTINISEPSYIAGNVVYYFVDIDSNAQMFFDAKQSTLSSSELDIVLSNKMIQDIMSAESNNAKDKLINMLMGFAFGAMLSGLIAMAYISNTQSELVDSLIDGVVVP